MSGLGPAACWLAHKRIESWSRMAKERVGAVRKVTLDRNSEDSPSTSQQSNSTTNNASSNSATTGSTAQTPPLSQPMTPPPSASSITSNTSGICSVTDSYELHTDSEQEVNFTKESQHIHPQANLGSSQNVNADILRGPSEALHSPMHLHHQSRSFPPRLQRTPSISSQSSVDSAPSRQSCHRGSSPQIRTFGPDGRSSLPTEPIFPYYLSRTPSPMRTISLDARAASQIAAEVSDLRTPSPSQNSLNSLSSIPNTTLTSPHSAKHGSRCISPLLIPPRIQPNVDPNLGPASPLGAIQPDLYKGPDGPINLNAPENSPALGRLHLRVKYDYHLFDLTVHLIEAHNLCPIEEGGFRDPYVRLLLEPEVDKRKRQTLIHRGESSPYFDQHFKFPVSRDQLQGKELILQVLDYDRYSHNDIIGEVRISIDNLDLSKSVEIWGDLLRTKKPPEDRPELLCSLNYLPQAERLTVVIMKAKNLDTIQETYVKLYLILNGKRVKKRKTSISKSEDPTHPTWNEPFTFNLQSSYLHNAAIEIYVVSAGGESQDIGSIGLGPQESGTGCQHWHDMINNARKPTAMWHYIR
ncbi:synaptotagmin-C isoform X1 [Stomoxys calcitrans]|uniref:synaptotagmin-C isoform X1 n=1 Tax=Stomoxys calcitrans TaxID=35570 RepID=UPI0027E2847A|nr:synaptotagmin-C isoform X1 [Stomoxys calcitrans]